MDNHLLLVFIFTATVHCISTLAYAVRLVGIKTGKLAVSFALFNVLVLISRTANSFQGPLLAKKIEMDLASNQLIQAGGQFQWLIMAASVGTLVGAMLIPTFQGIFARLVIRFNIERSIPRILIHGFSKAGIKQIRSNLKIPSHRVFHQFRTFKALPKRLLLLHTITVSLLTAGVFAALYAAYFNPDLRVTCSNLSPVINGFATIMLVIFVDPYFSLLTDDVFEGKQSLQFYYQCVIAMVVTRFIGTLLAQAILYPAARLIVFVAEQL